MRRGGCALGCQHGGAEARGAESGVIHLSQALETHLSQALETHLSRALETHPEARGAESGVIHQRRKRLDAAGRQRVHLHRRQPLQEASAVALADRPDELVGPRIKLAAVGVPAADGRGTADQAC